MKQLKRKQNWYLVFFVLLGFWNFSVAQNPNFKSKQYKVQDSIQIDSVSILPNNFTVKLPNTQVLDSSFYSVNFKTAILVLNKKLEVDSIEINYTRFPDFLTKTYRQFDKSAIVNTTKQQALIYKLQRPNFKSQFKPFDGLTTSGSISRGVTVGNNQNSVLNSELDLQISGKLSDNVSLRASIQDANIPLQESGYSQRLDEFDQIFVELFSENWNIRAGDIDLENRDSYFSGFSKRVQGLLTKVEFGKTNKTTVFASGALVRGQFTTSQFTAQEGNQGPYKLQGPNNELFVLVVSGSETVYVNGIALKRGENEDYSIDYNAGEISFNATFPITSEMRITVDYQFSERNYSRLLAYGGAAYQNSTFKIAASIYSETDSKNRPLQQNLSPDQVAVLSAAGDDKTLMVAPSENQEAFNTNRILYKKTIINGVEVFEFSNSPDDTLYSVRFSNVGENNGDYVLANTTTISNIYEYVVPVAGQAQGNFAPVVQLIAPSALQIAVINGTYTPSKNTTIDFEIAGSKNDLNLFSNANDEDNSGFATQLKFKQNLIKKDTLWAVNAFLNGDYVHKNFRNIEGLYNIEFNRDWNIDLPSSNQIISDFGNQSFLSSGVSLQSAKHGQVNYRFEHLKFESNFTGNRHVLEEQLKFGRFSFTSVSSYLKAKSITHFSTFLRSSNRLQYRLKKAWLGVKYNTENNTQKEQVSQKITPLSQRFQAYEVFSGIGDSSKVFAELGYKFRVNDSVKNKTLKNVNHARTYYLKAQLLKNTQSQLFVYANYRQLNFADKATKNENSLNSRIQYTQKLFKNGMHFNTLFETNSGRIARQDFTYVEVEAGQGNYIWNDYNANNIQELEEFEVAQFQDQGAFIRVLLPNSNYLKTHQNKWSASLIINPQQWVNSKYKTAPFWSHFYSQTSYLIDRKIKRNSRDFNLNPFNSTPENQLGLQLNFRTALFFNRGKQHYTTSYTYLNNQTRSNLSVGLNTNTLTSHNLQFNHKISTHWLANFNTHFQVSNSESENFSAKNYNIQSLFLAPKLSYLVTSQARFNMFFEWDKKENTIGLLERLSQQTYGVSFTFSKAQKAGVSGEFNYVLNTFDGNANSPVGYQLLEGLQAGNNFVWRIMAQKKLTTFLDLNLNYSGRKTETSKTIHTGNIQLKAYF